MHETPTYADFRTAVEYFQANFMPHGTRIDLSGIYDLKPHLSAVTSVEVQSDWWDAWPNADRKGVYALFGSQLDLIYIGKVSMKNTIGARLSGYFINDNEGICKLKDSRIANDPRYISTAAFPDDIAFFSAALEEFLIAKLNPINNQRGRTMYRQQEDTGATS